MPPYGNNPPPFCISLNFEEPTNVIVSLISNGRGNHMSYVTVVWPSFMDKLLWLKFLEIIMAFP